jgi:hypothetical protein
VIGDDGTHYGRLWSFRGITDRVEREERVKQQRDELIELQRINALVRKSMQALQDTTTRTEIETAVCEALTGSDMYQAAWIGDWNRRPTGGRTVYPQTAAGVSESYLEGISKQENGPAVTALHTGEVQVIDDTATAAAFPDERRETALAHDHQTLAAVPITNTDSVYGVLAVYAPSNHTINETEQEILADLGQSIALAIQRVQSQRSLTAETVVSLDLRIPASKFVFAEVTTELGCELSLERRIAGSGGVTIYYLDVQGAPMEGVCKRLEMDSLIDACTVVGQGDSAHPELLEVKLTNDSHLPLDVLTDYGATVISARAVDGDITVRVELPMQVEVRNVLSAVREVAPSIELVSKRQIDRPTRTVASIRDGITDQLTDKQMNALKSAYARGYYAWPRGSTMEEIAETVDISSPSLHYRLRKAHKTIIGDLLDPQQDCDSHH